MSIEQRGPTKWRFTVSKDGEIFRKNFIGSEREAKKAHDAFKVDVERGMLGTNENMKLGDLAQLVMDEYVKPKLKYTTRRIYTTNYNNHILPELGNMKLSAIKTLHIQKFSNELAKKYKATTVDSILSTLSVTLGFAVKWKFIKESPYQFIEKPKVSSSKDEIMSLEDIGKLLTIYEDESNLLHKAAFYLAIGCGLRNSEIRALTTDDIDFKAKTISINKQDGLFYDKDGKVQSGNVPTKTEGSIRKIYAPDFVMDVLAEYIKGIPYSPITKQIFFNANTGKPISKHCLSKRFAALLREHGLPSIRFHDLRHLHATLLINTGINVKSISKRLGHSRVATTLDVYSHSIEAIDKEVADSLDNTLMDIKNRVD